MKLFSTKEKKKGFKSQFRYVKRNKQMNKPASNNDNKERIDRRKQKFVKTEMRKK